jgi:glycosyltransferase involved in cell wall biosynthesis
MLIKNKISVIIPAFNREKTIKYCLTSVLNQTYPPYEIIIVDDCSTDKTIKVVQTIGDQRIRCLVQPYNTGAQAARNCGIREAKGEWIAFQDSDDEWTEDKLEKQVAALQYINHNPMTVVHSDAWRYDQVADTRELWTLPYVDGENAYPQLLTSPAPLFPTILTTKAALESIGLLDENVPSYQEWDTSIRLAKICRFIHIREPLFIYHLHGGETISKNRKKDIDGYQYIVDKFRDEILERCGVDTLNQHLSDNAIRAKRYGFDADALNILEKCHGRLLKVALLR